MKLPQYTWFPFTRTALSLVLSFGLLACATPKTKIEPIVINMVAINDFHGHLEKEKINFQRVTDKAPQSTFGAGIEVLGANIQAWRKQDKDLLFVGGGDLIGLFRIHLAEDRADFSGFLCGVLFTEDLQDGMRFGELRVVNPFALRAQHRVRAAWPSDCLR